MASLIGVPENIAADLPFVTTRKIGAPNFKWKIFSVAILQKIALIYFHPPED